MTVRPLLATGRPSVSLQSVLSLLLLLAFTASARGELPDFTALVQKASPAVVNIRTKRAGQAVPEVFRRFLPDRGQQPARGLGSGFIISADGYILTNNHVVDDATEIIVALSDRREPRAVVVGQDPLSDLALLKIDIEGLPTVEIGESESLQAGQWVVAIGSPFNFSSSVSAGIVSATGRSLPYSEGDYVPFIQTDVAINPGNSGGPLLDLAGRVVGINSQIYTRSGGSIGLSFAIPIDVAMEVVAQLKETGRVSRGWLGLGIQSVNRNLAEAFGMDRAVGALVTEIVPASPAEAAGFKRGDVVVAFNGKAIELSSDLPHIVGRTRVASEALVDIIRDAEQQTLTVTIGELEADELLSSRTRPGGAPPENRLGAEVVDLSEADQERLELEGGVLVRQVYQGPIQDAGIRRGDVITMLHHQWVTDVKQFRQLVAALPANQAIPIRIIRGKQPSFRAIKIIE